MTRYRAENFEDVLAHCEKVIDKLTKQIEGKNGYKERIQQLYEENLRLGNEKLIQRIKYEKSVHQRLKDRLKMNLTGMQNLDVQILLQEITAPSQ